tara:strand:- start:6080 stop:7087 length:1008 start_codon:yes stop_codon:yes gene_type:complete
MYNLKMKDKEEVKKICEELSHDNLLIQGTGGNISWKEDSILWIKASGTSLKDSLSKEIFVPLDLNNIRNNIANKIFDFTLKVENNTTLKPSIETLLHGLICKKYVVHLHAINPLSYLVRNDFSGIFDKISQNNFTYSVIDYAKPGQELAKKLHSEIKLNGNRDIYYLKNHGTIYTSDNINELRNLIKISCDIMYLNPCKLNKAKAPISKSVDYMPIKNSYLHNFVLDKKLLQYVKKNWAIFPDHVVFVGDRPCIYPNWDKFIQSNEKPLLIFIKGEGVFHLKSIMQNEIEQLNCYFDVICRQDFDKNLSVLTQKQISELTNWDAEIYRQSLIKKI